MIIFFGRGSLNAIKIFPDSLKPTEATPGRKLNTPSILRPAASVINVLCAIGGPHVSSNSQTRLTPAGHTDFRELLHSQIFSRLRVGGFLCHSNTNLSIVYRGIFQIFKYILYSGKSLLSTISRSGPKTVWQIFPPYP